MSAILEFFHSPVVLYVLFVTVSSAIRALPEPLPMGSRFYLWFYRFSQGALANWDLARNSTTPQQQQ